MVGIYLWTGLFLTFQSYVNFKDFWSRLFTIPSAIIVPFSRVILGENQGLNQKGLCRRRTLYTCSRVYPKYVFRGFPKKWKLSSKSPGPEKSNFSFRLYQVNQKWNKKLDLLKSKPNKFPNKWHLFCLCKFKRFGNSLEYLEFRSS